MNDQQANSVGGPALDALAAQAKDWYISMRERLIAALLEGGYPFGAVKLSPLEQWQKFQAMTPVDWQNLEQSLMNLHRGKPDAPFLVERALGSYVRLMHNLGQVYGTRPLGTPPASSNREF